MCKRNKSWLLLLICAIVMLFSTNEAKGQGKEAYIVLRNDTLTFYYKKLKPNDASKLSSLSEIYWKQKIKIAIFDESFKDYKPITCYNWFGGCNNLTEIVGMSENLNTENVTDMSNMFYCCYHLSAIDLSGFKTDKVTNMQAMFMSCSKIRRLDISRFNTENVTDMNNMFANTRLTYLDVSKLNTSNVTNMAYMFQNCGNLDFDFRGFNTTKVTNMRGMFKGCSNTNIDLSMLNTENVTNMSEMFEDCRKLKTIYVGEKWNTDKVSSSERMFGSCGKLYGGKGTSSQEKAISDKTYAKIDGGNDSPGYLAKAGEPVFTVSKEAYALLHDNTLTFYYAETIPEDAFDIDAYDLASNSGIWRKNVKKVVFDISFKEYRPLSCMNWFYGCEKLTAFEGMKENLNTEKVRSMSGMFDNCRSLTELDLSGFNTVSVKNMDHMFDCCHNLKTIYVSNSWNIENVLYDTFMFSNCYKLCGGNGSSFDYWRHFNKSFAKIDEGENNPGYLTLKPMSIFVKTLPKTEYLEGNILSLDGGILEIVYGSDIIEYVELTHASVSGFDPLRVGEQTLTVEYLGEKTTFNVKVTGKTVTSIEISQLPKTEYIEGQNLDLSEGTFIVKYDNETFDKLELSKAAISGFDKNKIGEQTLCVQYQGEETSFNVIVKEKTVISIEITRLPIVIYQEGKDLNLDNGCVFVRYNNDTSEEVALTSATISGYDPNRLGEQIITVEYLGLKTEFKVTVSEKKDDPSTPVSEIDTNNAVKIYSYGKTIIVENGGSEIKIINASGWIVRSIHTDCNRMEISMQKSGLYIVKTDVMTQKVLVE